MKAILTDMMGTTCPAGFVKGLVKDFVENGKDFLNRAGPDALGLLEEIRQKASLDTGEQVVEYIAGQYAQKNYRPEFLEFSGLVNVDGYDCGRIVCPFFDDVPKAFQDWGENGKGIYVYSSGSEDLQKAMFQKSDQGDLSVFIDRFFDTKEIGKKTDSDSYKRISDEVKTDPGTLLYLSDLTEELDAACNAGLDVKLVKRPGNKPVGEHNYQAIKTLLEVMI